MARRKPVGGLFEANEVQPRELPRRAPRQGTRDEDFECVRE